ncbi:MAG: PEP-utilizing enzyme [Micrococcales bacterium]|nr:PEP-utilizing enzyme [Micrococcales bacterium]
MRMLDDSNVAENYPGVCSPLTCTFAEETYRLVFRRLAGRLLGGDRRPDSLDAVLDQMAVAFDGRMYYRLDSWYHLLQILPFSGRLIGVWQRSLGVSSSDLPEPLPDVGWRLRARVLRRLVAAWRATPRLMTQLEDEFAEIQRLFDDGFDPTDVVALRGLFDQIKTGALRSWDITLVNDLRAFGYTALARRLGRPVVGVELVSVAPLRALAALRARPDLDDLAGLATDDAVLQLVASGSPLGAALGAYLEAYGDRGPGELKLESQTFRTHPSRLVRLVLAGGDQDGSGRRSAAGPADQPPLPAVRRPGREHRGRRADEGREQPNGDAQRAVLDAGAPPVRLRGVSARALQAIAFRESSRLNRARLYGMVRAIAWAVGHNLAQAGQIDEASDVFYLTLDEMITADRDLRQTVAARRAQWAEYEQLPTRSRIVLDDDPLLEEGGPTRQSSGPRGGGRASTRQKSGRSKDGEGMSTRPAAEALVLTGTVVSAGAVEAEVVVVTDPATDATGKIVVAVATDPGWVFVLADAAGIVTERGSMLSHTAIVARELGLPAVVGVTGATSVLRTGDRVRLDATAGRIEVLARG